MTDLGPPIASRWLSASIYLTIAVMCALGIAGLSSRAAQAAAVALCLAFALLYPLMFRRARSERGRAGYYAAQALVIAGLMLLRSRNGDVFTFLFFLMSIRVASSSPPRAAAAWICGFCLVSSGILLWANGRGALFALAFNAATFFFSGVFGFTLRQVAIANREKQRLLDDLRAAQRQLHELAVAEERNRLARDLHDSVKQQVFAIGMRLGAARATLAPESPGYEHVVAAEGMARAAGGELTALIRALRPAALEQRGLPDALRDYVAEWSRASGIAAAAQVEGARALPPGAEQALFRVAQEALANVARHSGAASARVRLIYDPARVLLEVRDDGRGFRHSAAPGGIGLDSMAERMAAIGGRLQIDGESGPGTQVLAVYEYAEQQP